MTPALRLLTALALSTACAAPALAASSAVTSASDSLSTSVDSLSRSIKKSSDSSARTVVGQGDYRVVQVAQVEAGTQDVTLQAVPGRAPAGSSRCGCPTVPFSSVASRSARWSARANGLTAWSSPAPTRARRSCCCWKTSGTANCSR
jgi:hypothetical protein